MIPLPAMLYLGVVAALLAFLAVYMTRTLWTVRPEGWHLVGSVLVWIINSLLAASVIIFGPYPGVQVVRTIVAVLTLVVAVGLLVSLLVVQRRARGRDAMRSRP